MVFIQQRFNITIFKLFLPLLITRTRRSSYTKVKLHWRRGHNPQLAIPDHAKWRSKNRTPGLLCSWAWMAVTAVTTTTMTSWAHFWTSDHQSYQNINLSLIVTFWPLHKVTSILKKCNSKFTAKLTPPFAFPEKKSLRMSPTLSNHQLFYRFEVLYEAQKGFLTNKLTFEAILKFNPELHSTLNKKERFISDFLLQQSFWHHMSWYFVK